MLLEEFVSQPIAPLKSSTLPPLEIVSEFPEPEYPAVISPELYQHEAMTLGPPPLITTELNEDPSPYPM
jgi:hypothetical protein